MLILSGLARIIKKKKKKKKKSEDGSAVFKRLREGVAIDPSNSYHYMILSVWVHNIEEQ